MGDERTRLITRDIVFAILFVVTLSTLAYAAYECYQSGHGNGYNGIGDPDGDVAGYFVTLKSPPGADGIRAYDGKFAVSYYEVAVSHNGLAYMRAWLGSEWHWFGYSPDWIAGVEKA